MHGNKRHISWLAASAFALAAFLPSCREDEVVIPTEYDQVDTAANIKTGVVGMYLVNEGNMGSNKCTLDYYDFTTGVYSRNFYSEKNPTVVKELGDVGNDIQIYGSKLYVVVNCSNKVEVLDANSGVRIGQIDIPNCRYIRFAEGKAYVSSYVGPVAIDPDAVRGQVYRVDTASLAVEATVTVGFQPDELEILNGKIYVCNSGGYRVPDYDNTVSVIDLETFTEERQIPVGINLHRIRKDHLGQLWVSSRGDYEDVASRLFVLAPDANGDMQVTDTIGVGCSNLCISGDSLLLYSTEWSNYKQENTTTYGVIDIKTHSLISTNFITDGTETDITIPYGIAVHPETREIFVTDAKNYVSSGNLLCYSASGKLRWTVKPGDIPAHMAFLYR